MTQYYLDTEVPRENGESLMIAAHSLLQKADVKGSIEVRRLSDETVRIEGSYADLYAVCEVGDISDVLRIRSLDTVYEEADEDVDRSGWYTGIEAAK